MSRYTDTELTTAYETLSISRAGQYSSWPKTILQCIQSNLYRRLLELEAQRMRQKTAQAMGASATEKQRLRYKFPVFDWKKKQSGDN